MIKKVGVFIIVLVVMTFCVRQGVTQDKDEEKSPANQIKQVADRMQRLQRMLNKAQRAGDDDTAKWLRKRLIKARNKEQAILKRLVEKLKTAKKQGRTKDAQKMGRLIEKAMDTSEYTRSLRKSPVMRSRRDSPVVINEICYWPEKSECEWVELKNISEKPVDMDGWGLLNGLNVKFSIPDKLPPVPPNGYVLIRFDGTGKPPSLFGKKGKAVVHTPAHLTGNVFGNRAGHLALCGSNEFSDYYPDAIRSYVAWGGSPGKLLAEALDSTAWSRQKSIVEDTRIHMVSRDKIIEQGGSIGLPPRDDVSAADPKIWRIAFPSEVSPGTENIPYPMPRAIPPHPTSAGKDGKVSVGCTGIKKKGVRYHFQVFTDKGCTELFEEAPTVKPKTSGEHDFGSHVYYVSKKTVPEDSVVYWRVRAVYPDGGKSKWTKPLKIRRGYPDK